MIEGWAELSDYNASQPVSEAEKEAGWIGAS